MSFKRALRCLFVAAAFGLLCEFTAVVGALIVLAAGILAFMRMSRYEHPVESWLPEYWAWLMCVVVFSLTAFALAPFIGEIGGSVALALCLCSPLLGTLVYIVERYLGGLPATF